MTDKGHYECQVNTEPKINLGFWLNILRKLVSVVPQSSLSFSLAATAVIHGESSVFVKPGSTISLTCTIRLFSSPPTNIQWYKDARWLRQASDQSVINHSLFRALNLDSARGGVSLENEKTPQVIGC